MSNTNGNSDNDIKNNDNIEDNFENLSDLIKQDLENFEVLRERVRNVSTRIDAARDVSQEQLNAFRDLYNVLTTHDFVFHIGQIIDEIDRHVNITEDKIKFREKEFGLH